LDQIVDKYFEGVEEDERVRGRERIAQTEIREIFVLRKGVIDLLLPSFVIRELMLTFLRLWVLVIGFNRGIIREST